MPGSMLTLFVDHLFLSQLCTLGTHHHFIDMRNAGPEGEDCWRTHRVRGGWDDKPGGPPPEPPVSHHASPLCLCPLKPSKMGVLAPRSWAHIVHCRAERTRRPRSHESVPKRPIVGFSSGRLRLWAELNHSEEKGCLLGKTVLFSSYMLLALKSWRRCLIVEVQSFLPKEPRNNLFDYRCGWKISTLFCLFIFGIPCSKWEIEKFTWKNDLFYVNLVLIACLVLKSIWKW